MVYSAFKIGERAGSVRLVRASVCLSDRLLAAPVHVRMARALVRLPDRLLAALVHVHAHARPFQPVLAPKLMAGPTATPALTTCAVAWTVDIAAYHRVRYKVYGGGSWTESAWSALATTNASVTLTGLTGERTRYEYEIQSDLDKTGKTEGWWAGAWTFYTTCNNAMTLSMGDIDNNEGGTTLWVNWMTNTKSYGSLRWRLYPGGAWEPWSSYDLTYTRYHYTRFVPFIYDGDHSKTFYVQFRAKNACDFVFTFARTYTLQWDVGEGMWLIY